VKGASRKTQGKAKSQVDLKLLRTAYAALGRAEERHHRKVEALDKARDVLQARADKEAREWRREKERLANRISRLKGGEKAARL